MDLWPSKGRYEIMAFYSPNTRKSLLGSGKEQKVQCKLYTLECINIQEHYDFVALYHFHIILKEAFQVLTL